MKLQLNKGLFSLIASVVIAVVALLVLSGCGARKVNRNKSEAAAKTEEKAQSTEQTKQQTNIKESKAVVVDDQNQSITEEYIVEPIDPAKAAKWIDERGVVRQLFNVKITTKKTTQQNNKKTNETANLDIVDHKETAKKVVATKKEAQSTKAKAVVVDRKGGYFMYLFVFVVLLVLWFLWSKKE
jgi:uncharacterized protein YceK